MSKESAIKQVLSDVVGRWLIPANRFMQELQRVHPEDWGVAIEESLWDEARDMEIQQYWIVHNERLQSLMVECGCKFIQLEEVHVWCNPSSERFGSLAMHELGEMLCAGTIDTQFNKVKS
jgi:hypothetical protein